MYMYVYTHPYTLPLYTEDSRYGEVKIFTKKIIQLINDKFRI